MSNDFEDFDAPEFGGFEEPQAAAAPVPLETAPAATSKKDKAARGKKSKSDKKDSVWNLYTTLLGISLVAIALACLFLFVELWRYDFDYSAERGRQVPSAAPSTSALPSALPNGSSRA